MLVLIYTVSGLAGLYIILRLLAVFKNDKAGIDADNPYLNPDKAESVLPEDMVRYAVNMPKAPVLSSGAYKKFFKRAIDSFVSFFGLLILSPLFIALIIAIKIDDPGPVFFIQNRVGKDCKFFRLHKFRSMKMSTPSDIPTHMLENPEQYITRVGKFLRKASLDELPQIWDIFRGKMSIIGPRPALWNQADLVNEREKYGVNGLYPGLTGLAQISGRDELEIPEKVKFDAQYAEKIGFIFDVKCFFGTIGSVAKADGVVEGGTGELEKQYNGVKK